MLCFAWRRALAGPPGTTPSGPGSGLGVWICSPCVVFGDAWGAEPSDHPTRILIETFGLGPGSLDLLVLRGVWRRLGGQAQ